MDESETAMAGIGNLQSCIRAMATGDNAAALSIVNSVSSREARWMLASALSALRAMVEGYERDDVAAVRDRLLTFADGMAEDVVTNGAAVLLDEIARREGLSFDV